MLTNLATGASQSLTTGGDGLYTFVNLNPGDYRLEVQKDGFKHYRREPVTIQVQQSFRIDPALESKQIGRLQAARAKRDGAAVEAALAALRDDAANEQRNLMEPLLACARAHASEGEIVESLQQVFGDYTETPVF